MAIDEFDIKPSGVSLLPHSVAIGPNRWLWVTTESSTLVQIDRNDPTAQQGYTNMMPQYSAGILKDPEDRKVVWFASPAGPQHYDPIYEFDVERGRIINKHDLQPDALAQTISAVQFKVCQGGSEKRKSYILFAEPRHSNIGYVEVGQDGANFYDFPKSPDEFDTWLWSVTATVDPSETKFTIWATGQQYSQPARKTNGIYTWTPGSGNPWRRISLPTAGQKPIHIIAGDVTENGETKTCLWVSAKNPNQILRRDIKNETWKASETISGEPAQLAFGPDGYIWVAGSDKIYRFTKDASVRAIPSPGLPTGSTADGICVDHQDKVVWYTNRAKKKIGKYPIPQSGLSRLGKTQLVSQQVTTVAPGDVAEEPLVASFVAGANPTPGIPLTCRIVSEEATFLDGTRERVLETDVTGQVFFPAVRAGKVEEEAVLAIGWGDNEPATTVILNVRDTPEDDEA